MSDDSSAAGLHRRIMSGGSSRPALRTLDAVLWPLRQLRLGPTRMAMAPVSLPEDLPILVAANHTSWWDGFLVREAHERLRPHDPFCIVMTARELSKRPWLRTLGAVGIQPGSVASIRRTYRNLAIRRNRARTFFVFFPQGEIWPSSRRPLGFRRGIDLLSRMLAPVVVLPAAIHIEPLARSVPTPFLSLGEPAVIGARESIDAATLESMVERELDAIRSFLDRHGENAIDAWPAFRRTAAQTAAPQ